jgi:hypothetical protein
MTFLNNIYIPQKMVRGAGFEPADLCRNRS